MDARRFDALTRALSAGSRRGLLGVVLALPVAGSLLALLLDVEEVEGKGRRKRRRRRHRHGQNRPKNRRKKRRNNRKKRCRKKSRAKICRGKCGIVKNRKTCKKKVNCGACPCDPPCPVCQTCEPGATTPGLCEPDPAADGQPCGEAGAVCVAGVCVPCTPDTANLPAAVAATPAGGTLPLCAGDFPLDTPVHITRDLTLLGAGAGQTILHGPEADRVLQIANAIAVTVQGLTVTDGTGGITNAGDLTLCEVVVTGNTAAPGAGGGGIFNTGLLTLATGSRVAGNAAAAGGGIRNSGGEVILQAGSVVGGDDPTDANSATDDGGGIFNSGILTLAAGSQVAGNSAADIAGGIYNDGTLTLEDGSQVVGNSANNGGAGIYNVEGTVNVDDGAFICGNQPESSQCSGVSPCPNIPVGERCPA